MAVEIGAGIDIGLGICIGEGCEVFPPGPVLLIITEDDLYLQTEYGDNLTTE